MSVCLETIFVEIIARHKHLNLMKILRYFTIRRKQIVEFVPKLYALQDANRPDETEWSKVKERDVSKLSYTFLSAGHVADTLACFKPFSRTNPEMPLVCWYPLDWENDATSFWIVYPYSVICAFVIMELNITLDCFSYYLMNTLATEVLIIGRRLEELGTNAIGDDIELEKLVACIKRHQHAMDLIHEMENFLSIQFFAQICLSGTVFCTGVYQLTSVKLL
ncbi:odorant receptor 33a-like [Bradysia coprophila]|uniref:odorant receptor 33a-like n=1 Tax=Bradysia coprophila TaxID=38358 RepID=UPI00187D8E3B|nr:odorant receptor 33a-like [Bradysia coprophila]